MSKGKAAEGGREVAVANENDLRGGGWQTRPRRSSTAAVNEISAI
jgi:hypothetical protein